MYYVLALVVGVIIGWFIDWFFWRRQSGPSAKETTLQRDLEIVRAQNKELSIKLEDALNRKPEVIIKEVKITSERDLLQKIKGIGDVFANRLNEAGIHTFSDLASTSPERIEEIIKPQKWQEFNYREWADAARDMAEQQRPQA